MNAQLERQGLGLRWTYKPTGIAIEQTQLIVHGRKGGLDFSAMRTVHGKPKLPSGSLPFQCGETTSFNASGTGLTSLKGAPINVVGDCDVRWNRLVSLRGLPFQFGILLAVDNPMLTMLDAAIHLAPLGADALGSLDDTATRARTLGTGLGAIQQAVRVQRWAPDEPSSRPPGIGNTDA